MIEATLKAQLEPIARSHRRINLRRQLAFCWTGAALLGLILLGIQWAGNWHWSWPLPALIFLTLAVALWLGWQNRLQESDYRRIASKIETDHPELHSLLMAAVEQHPDQASGRLNFLQERVIREALEHNQLSPWAGRNRQRLFYFQLAHWGTLAALVLVLLAMGTTRPGGLPGSPASNPVKVTPGDTSIERGSSLVILARFEKDVPSEATLVLSPAVGGESRRIPLDKNLDDPVFGTSLLSVDADQIYRIEYANRSTPDYQLDVFEYPALDRADAQLTFPNYTGKGVQTIEDTLRISAVEGTRLQYTFQLNKPVRSARLISEDQQAVELTPVPDEPQRYQVDWTLQANHRYTLQLQDDQDRTNQRPAEFVINVIENKPPELKLTFPPGDQRVSPLEEIAFQAEAGDDFGLGPYGIAYTLAGQKTQFIELGTNAPANEKQEFAHLLSMEQLGVQPDQLVTYFVWAEDIGPDGKPRRTFSDMFFAEVRPFDEIFREGGMSAGQSSGSQGGGGPMQELAKLQKQIINATWKLRRQEPADPPSDSYADDAKVVEDSQSHALDQVKTVQARAEDPQIQAIAKEAEEAMDKALDELKVAAADETIAPLPAALEAEQSAYQALLQLQAREHQVTQNRGGGGGGGGGQRAQRQLNQLELKEEESLYETERQASREQNPMQREELQVLNRLRELARRQDDLNERLKELQTALQEAESEKEKEEIRRQLKRLREDQQQILADMDELDQRMAQSRDQSTMSEARRQLEQTRSDVQRASQQLSMDELPQALASGTRAQREMEQLRDDFRKKTSSQFTEQMRRMRSQAREMAENQERFDRQFEQLSQNQRQSLSDSPERQALTEQMNQQHQTLTNLLNQVRTVSEQSENSEPLLSKELYDTWRLTDQSDVEDQVAMSRDLLERGFIPQAQEFHRRADPHVQDLKEGIEQAAESVLGDEAEALRFARNELEDLQEQLNQELEQNAPRLAQASAPSDARQPDADNNQSTTGGEPTAEQRQNGASRQANQETESDQSPGQSSQSQSQSQAQSQSGSPSESQSETQTASGSGQAQSESRSQSQSPSPSQSSAQADSNRPGGASGGGTPQSDQPTPANQPQNGPGNGGSQQAANQPNSNSGIRFLNQGGSAGGPGGPNAPLTGSDYRQWSDRLRNVEEALQQPDMRHQAARVREAAREMRAEFKRHGKKPQWDLVHTEIVEPLAELHRWVQEELARQDSREALVPIDRDPVPSEYSELVRRYYENLGKSQ